MINIDDWCSTYRNIQPLGINFPCNVNGKCKKVLGGRVLYAEVELKFDQSKDLKFLSLLSDIEYQYACNEGWLKGIFLGVLDVMLVRPITPITIFSCTIIKIHFHKIDSSSQSFRIAGRYAAENFLAQEKFTVI